MMRTVIPFLNISLPILYGILIWIYAKIFVQSKSSYKNVAVWFFSLVLIIHLLYTIMRGFNQHYYPVTTKGEMLSLTALAIAIVYRFIEWRIKIKNTGLFVFITILLLQVFAASMIDLDASVDAVLQTPKFIVHVSSAVLAYAALGLCTLFSIIYLILYYSLKKGRFGMIYHISFSLEELSQFSNWSAMVGFILLSITIVSGIFWRKMAFPDFSHFDPQVVSSYVIWTIYGVFIYGKQVRNWSTKKLSYLSVGGAVTIFASLFIVSFVLDSFHNFG